MAFIEWLWKVPTTLADICIAKYEETLQLWHERFGHLNKRHVRKRLNEVDIHVDFEATKGFCNA